VSGEVIILASDGVWDVISNEEAVQLALKVYRQSREEGVTPEKAVHAAAKSLIDEAYNRNSGDNLTAVVFLTHVD